MTPAEEVKVIIDRHIEKLPEKERVVVLKVFFESKTIYLVAKELKISRHAVKYRLEKAKRMMKESIIEDLGMEKIETLLKEM